jgi:hypothetical protein
MSRPYRRFPDAWGDTAAVDGYRVVPVGPLPSSAEWEAPPRTADAYKPVRMLRRGRRPSGPYMSWAILSTPNPGGNLKRAAGASPGESYLSDRGARTGGFRLNSSRRKPSECSPDSTTSRADVSAGSAGLELMGPGGLPKWGNAPR